MKIALLPGGFKPPHLGHYNMAKYLADFIDDKDNVIVRIGQKEREGIGASLALEIWNYYKEFDSDPRAKKLIISVAQSPSPVKDVYDFVEKIAPKGSTVILGLGEKDAEDGRYNNIPKFAEPRNIKAEIELVPPQAGGISGTRMRKIIKANDKNTFFKYIPDYLPEEIKEEIWTKLIDATIPNKAKNINETTERKTLYAFDLDDTLITSNSQVIITNKTTGKVTKITPAQYATYIPNDNEELDFSEFAKLVNPQAIGKNFQDFAKILKIIPRKPDHTAIILTARQPEVQVDVNSFLEKYNLDNIQIHAVASSDPQTKADVIQDYINNGYTKIRFYDDALKNVKAIQALELTNPNTDILAKKVAFNTGLNEFMAGTMNKEEMAKHNANMRKLRKFLSKQTDQMVQVPTNLTKGLRRKLYEGRYDQETLLQGRFLFNKFKANFGEYYEEDTGGVIGFDKEAQEPIEYSLDFKFIPKENLQILPFVVDGEADDEIVKIKIKYNPNSFPEAYNDLNAEIRDTVRHELEHVAQHHFVKQVNPQGIKKKPTQTWYEYFTSDVEIPAFSQGLYKNAKFKKISFSKAVENFLLNYLDVLTDEEEASVIQTWTDYARKNIRTAQIDEKLTIGDKVVKTIHTNNSDNPEDHEIEFEDGTREPYLDHLKNENFPPYKANQVQQVRYKASDTFTNDRKKAKKLGYLQEKDPKKGTGKKPKGSGRRLYTDEDPSDTVKVKFSTRQDIVDTLSKKSFKAKSHARQSQVINLIHQRTRAAYNRAKDPAVKKRLKTALDYITKRKEASKRKTQRMRKEGLFSQEWWLNIITENLLVEGGNIFKDNEKNPLTIRINKTDVDPTLKWLENITKLDLLNNKLGSTGIKSTSGDLDIAVDSNEISKDELVSRLISWVKENHPEDDPKQWVQKSGISVHFKTPINGDPSQGFVQTDLMFSNNLEWMKFSFKGTGDNTPYTGKHRAILMSSIAKAFGYKLSPTQGLIDKDTNNIISQNPDKIASILLGPNSSQEDLESVESIYLKIKDHPKYNEMVNDALNNPIFKNINPDQALIKEGSRIDHAEDIIFWEGAKGALRALEALKNTASEGYKKVTLKWDGSPAIIFGRDENGDFILTDKNGYVAKGYDGKTKSADDLEKMLLSRGKEITPSRKLFAASMKSIFPYYEKAVPQDFRGLFKGDLLYYTTPPVEGMNYVFKPNTVKYAVDIESDLGKKIGKSKTGVVIHRQVDASGNETPLQDVNIFQGDDVLVVPPIVSKEAPIIPSNLIKDLEEKIKTNSKKLDMLLNPSTLKNLQISDFSKILYAYTNSKVDTSLDNLGSDFTSWLDSVTKISKIKKERIKEYISNNQNAFTSLWEIVSGIMNIKDSIIDSLDQQKSDIKQSIGSAEGGEGYVLAHPEGDIKLVPRAFFSKANRAIKR